ncbi:MFS transporter [Natronolimnohabitans innermongolicus]|uniref:Major facilitator superfamily protein n=1 Tax=Natronolimnohabitans innermongolicus JCM 12255 TaxID=1227499 RepID=L9WWL4_9EURY|nr:MFS transporter [Natronolimnohabitans innermongolicus]ELY53812.1 major facilitator superfamily protein [Natronolimnohabitans innermongolicus JCM 12255]
MRREYGIRYGPHLAAFSVGYVLFSYAAVPGVVGDHFDVGYTAVGLLMSAALASFVLVQLFGGRLVDDRSTVGVLLGVVTVNAALAVVMDLTDSFALLLALRGLWGLAGGLAVTVCATHISRVYGGPTATWHQGLNGGMFTAGGAVAYLVTPLLVDATGWFGVHAAGAVVAVPAAAVLWIDRDRAARTRPETRTREDETDTDGTSLESEPRRRADGGKPASALAVVRSPVVLLAAVCNFATLGAYVTLSTFVAAYFADLGIAGPLSAFALFVASLGRLGGGIAVLRPAIHDGRVIAGAAGVGAASLFALLVGDGIALVVLPLLALAAVSLPFGAVFKAASTATRRDGTAVAFVVAVGNVAALVLPAITGHLRDATGEYALPFALMGGLNVVAAVAGLAIARRG